VGVGLGWVAPRPEKAAEGLDPGRSYPLSVKVELGTWTRKVGEVRLERGRAVGSNERTRRLIASTKIIEPETFDLVGPSEGERYLRALPAAFRGTHFVAVLVEAPAQPPRIPSLFCFLSNALESTSRGVDPVHQRFRRHPRALGGHSRTLAQTSRSPLAYITCSRRCPGAEERPAAEDCDGHRGAEPHVGLQ
jgi:hypothetical protein